MTTVLITGANRGLGLEFARQYAEEGASVVACCRHPDGAEALRSLARAQPGVRVIPLDVTGSESIADLKTALVDQAIDILVLNAGVFGPAVQSFSTLEARGWLETFHVNAIAPVLITQALIENLRRGQGKRIAAITSQLGSTAQSRGGRLVYRSSKAALNNAMRGLSIDLAKDEIVVGLFHPGWVRTDMGGNAAPLTPEVSVAALRRRIADLAPNDSGAFRDYDGPPLPW